MTAFLVPPRQLANRRWRSDVRYDVIRNLVLKDIRVRYSRAVLGFAWSLGSPILTIGVYFVVFGHIFQGHIDRYALYLISGFLHWTLLSQVVVLSGDWLAHNMGLFRKLYFPRWFVPASSFLSSLAFWASALAIFVLAYVPLDGRLSSELLLYPVMLVPYLLFVFGLGLISAVLSARFRDVKHLIEVTMPLAFWLTPIVWTREQIPEGMRSWITINPLAPYFEVFHAILYRSQVPAASDAAVCVLFSALVLAIGAHVFRQNIDSIVERA